MTEHEPVAVEICDTRAGGATNEFRVALDCADRAPRICLLSCAVISRRRIGPDSTSRLAMRMICLVGMLASCRSPTAPNTRSEVEPTPSRSSEVQRCDPRIRVTDLGPSADARYGVWICGQYQTGRNRSIPFTYAIRIGVQRAPATPTPTDLNGLVGYGLEGHFVSRPEIGDEICVVFWGQEICDGTITAADLANLPVPADKNE